MDINFILLVISASSLPLLAILALFLRRNLFKGFWKYLILFLGFVLLSYNLFTTLKEHTNEITLANLVIGVVVGIITILILAKFSNHHHHNKETGAKGIVISEAFHSLIDGAVIGATYLVNPLLGYAATIGIVIHEFPKVIGTLAIFRGFGLSIKRTLVYGVLSQIGSPTSAILIYILGTQISSEGLHSLEIASISSLAAVVLWIIYLEIKYHTNHPHHN